MVLGFVLASFAPSSGQAPASLNLKVKLRDLPESPLPNFHPDFNTYNVFGTVAGYVDANILTTGIVDTTVFKNDNRNPKLVSAFNPGGERTFTDNPPGPTPYFDQWFNDDPSTDKNRPFLADLVFNNIGTPEVPLYEFNDQTFFPMDPLASGGQWQNLPGKTLAPFGITPGSNPPHNFGFTMELHSEFTYLAGTNQVFNFTGDDDVWVFVNGKLIIDLGGVHSAASKSFTLDAATASAYGLVDYGKYMLDFFFAERHETESTCKITTSIPLSRNIVAKPVATPGASQFVTQVNVTLETPTPDAKIYFTTNGATPDSNSTLYTTGIVITGTTTVKAIAYKTGFIKSEVMKADYTKTLVASTLDILDQNGSPLGGYISELNTSYTVKVTTTQAGLTSLSPKASTTPGGLDLETLVLGTKVDQGTKYLFSGTSPFAITTTAIGNNKTEAKYYDSLIVRWTNPTPGSTDIAEKHVLVRPAPVQGRAYFSHNANGTDTVDQYTGTETTLYLIVVDEVLPTTLTPKVTLVTTPTPISGHAADNLTLNLVPIVGKPGRYVATIPVDIVLTTSTADGRLQLLVGDFIKATYTDPMDVETPAVANAGFGVAPEIDANLQFTDALGGNVLPTGFHYSPANGNLFLTYSDDWAGGAILTKSVALTIVNTNGATTGTPDAETFNVTLNLTKHTGSTGVWEGSITLVDGPSIKPGNGKAETYVLGTVHAVVTSHTKTATAGQSATDDLLVAYPNQDPVITITGNGGPGAVITRTDDSLKVTITDQSISSATDTLFAELSCTESTDKVTIRLIETSPGVYKSSIISKSEGAKIEDGVLQCKSTDNIKVTYTDPAYGDIKPVSIILDNPVTPKLYFTTSILSDVPISSVSENITSTFVAVLVAHDPDINTVNIIPLTFTSLQGETETFNAVETGPATGIFKVTVPYGFVTGAISANQKVEGKITPQVLDNRVNITASANVENVPVKTDIVLVAAFDPVKKAYIKDTDGDGKADKVFIVFEKKLAHLPSTLGSQWNGDSSAFIAVQAGKLSFLPGSDSTIVVADYTPNPFGQDLTAPKAGQAPKAQLPAGDALFNGQNPVLEDSIGPVIISAFKRPPNVNALIPNDPSFNHDTLRITLSEPLRAGVDFKDMIKFSTTCGDYANAITLVAINNPVPDANGTYTVIIDNSVSSSPQTGNCIFLNADKGKFTDLKFNPPVVHGVPLEGANRNLNIQLFRGFPPVAGLDANSSNFQVAVQDPHDPKQLDITSHGVDPVTGAANLQVLWIPSASYVPNNPNMRPPGANVAVPNLDKMPSGNKETATPILLPSTLSTVQVVSTAPYIAHISIFDTYGNFVFASTQSFGDHGEMQNQARVVPKGLVSYLWWDMRDKNGQLAGQGVYVWKVRFEFKGGKQEIQYTRTGIMRTHR